jgi:hypothetical protein
MINRTLFLISLRFRLLRFFFLESETHEKRAKEIINKKKKFSNGPKRVVSIFVKQKKKNPKHQLSEKREKNLRSLCDLTVTSTRERLAINYFFSIEI